MYLLLLHVIPEMICVKGSEGVKLVFYFSSFFSPPPLPCQLCDAFQRQMDQHSNRGTSSSATAPCLGTSWDCKTLIPECVYCIRKSSLYHQRSCGQLHSETEPAGIMLHISVARKKPSKLLVNSWETSIFLKSWDSDSGRQLTPTQSLAPSFPLGLVGELKEQMSAKSVIWHKTSSIKGGKKEIKHNQVNHRQLLSMSYTET